MMNRSISNSQHGVCQIKWWRAQYEKSSTSLQAENWRVAIYMQHIYGLQIWNVTLISCQWLTRTTLPRGCNITASEEMPDLIAPSVNQLSGTRVQHRKWEIKPSQEYLCDLGLLSIMVIGESLHQHYIICTLQLTTTNLNLWPMGKCSYG